MIDIGEYEARRDALAYAIKLGRIVGVPTGPAAVGTVVGYANALHAFLSTSDNQPEKESKP